MDADSEGLGKHGVQGCEDGIPTREEITGQLQVRTVWVRRLLQRRRETGAFSSLLGGRGRKFKVTEAHRSRLSRLVENHLDATWSE